MLNDIQWSIPTILNVGIYGILMVGSDMCGFSGSTTEELCARWTALDAFYPFARSHNNLESNPQEMYVWESVAAIGRKLIGMHYRLLPYIYLHARVRSARLGCAIVRPLFFEFPSDATTHGSPVLDTQFMLGSAPLVTPVLTQGASKGLSVTWSAKLNDMPVHTRGGRILPLHQPTLTSAAAQQTPFDLLIAPANGVASGQLCLDDGDDINGDDKPTLIEFRLDSNDWLGSTLSMKVVRDNYRGTFKKMLNKVVVLGVKKAPSIVLVNIFTKVTAFKFDNATQRLEIDLSKLAVKVADCATVFWR